MDSARFDALAARLSAHLTRRRSLGLLGSLGAAGIGLGDADAKRKKKKPKKCKPACGPCQRCNKGTCQPETDGTGCGNGNTCQGGACTSSGGGGCAQDDAPCNGDGRCLNGVCQTKPVCLAAGTYFNLLDLSDDICCSKNYTFEHRGASVAYWCLPAKYDGDFGHTCFSDLDCAGDECVGYRCRRCSGPSCPPLYRFERTIGSHGTGSGQFTAPGPLAINPDGNLLVGANTRVLEFTPNGSLVRTIGTGVQGLGNGQFQSTISIAVDQGGNIYVGEGTRVQKFSRTGVYLRTFGVAGVAGTDNQHLTVARGLAVDRHGLLYIADGGNFYGRIQVFNTDGTYVRTIARSDMLSPGTIAFDAHDHLFVQDLTTDRAMEFDQNGTFVGSPVANVSSDYVSHFAFGPDGSFFICERVGPDDSRAQVVQYSPTWERVRAFNTATEPSPPANREMYALAITVDTAGNLYIVDSPSSYPAGNPPTVRILKYAPVTTVGHARSGSKGTPERTSRKGARHGSRRRQHRK